ncbi:anti-sigma regulatory factor (Ser/Thr protein kinase) [Catenulispora sp. GP43]|uniref:ATP-binding protein n=1 Tax=Catenulispora sp. GP43 TaxID=3156263 RepID=UPI0035195155
MSFLLLDTQDVAWFRDDLTGARRAAGRLAERIGLGEYRAGEVVLAVSEAVTNLAVHAVAGTILLRTVRTAQHTGIEFLAVDSGPGMADVAASMRDGHSTAGTLGIGLGTIARLADAFDMHSILGQGTVMLARFWPLDVRSVLADEGDGLPQLVVEGVTRPISGARECGDGWAVRLDDTGTPASSGAGQGRAVLVMLCDGLGHGPLAEMASRAAIHAFRAGPGRSPEEVMGEIHRRLADIRGAAVAVARIEPDRARVLFCGVGEIAAAIVTPTSKAGLPILPGIAGHRMRTLRTSTHPLPAGSAVVLHSDGLSGRWNPATLPGVLEHSPAVIAGHLLRSAGKHHDDASVVVAKGPW